MCRERGLDKEVWETVRSAASLLGNLSWLVWRQLGVSRRGEESPGGRVIYTRSISYGHDMTWYHYGFLRRPLDGAGGGRQRLEGACSLFLGRQGRERGGMLNGLFWSWDMDLACIVLLCIGLMLPWSFLLFCVLCILLLVSLFFEAP